VRRTLSAAVRNGTNILGVVLSTREYFENVGGGTIDGYLAVLGPDILGRGFAPTVSANLAARIRKGTPLVKVVKQVLMSQAGRSAQIQTSIETILGGPSTTAEVDRYLAAFGGNLLQREIAAQLYGSAEFYSLVTT